MSSNPSYKVCRVCKSANVSALHQGVKGFGINAEYDIIKCADCGMAFTYPFLTEEQIKEYYDDQAIAFNGSGGDDLLDDYKKHKSSYWKKLGINERFNEIIRMKPDAKSHLDIGCGAGFFIDYSREQGLDVYGLELSEWGFQSSRKLGLNTYKATIQDSGKLIPAVDVITMYDVLEHGIDPRDDLMRAYQLLNPGGILVVNLPNLDSFMSHATGKSWNKLIPPNHTYHFTKRALSKLVSDAGFEIRQVSTNHGSREELMQELLVSPWRVAGKIVPNLMRAYEMKDRPFNESGRSKSVAVIKVTQKIGRKLGPIGHVIIPVIGAFGAGEGLHLIAVKP